MADIDIGEMLLTFPLDKLLQPYCGVVFGPYLPEVLSWVRWLRCAMGLKPSPYVAIWFMENYNPSLPWVSKIHSDTKRIASDYVGYVDDLRPVGESEAACNQCARRVSCMLGSLGIQDASRKRQGASKVAGVWAGAVVFANDEGVGVNCTQEKWDKAKGYLLSIQAVLDSGEPINHKMLERIRFFLLYVTRTYPSMVPFLKGIHLTLDSWRPGRDSDGWRYTLSELHARYEFEKGVALEFSALHAKGAPEFVYPSSRLCDDIATLQRMTSAETPPRRFVRSRLIVTACYGFGDASGSGFGSTISGRDGLRYRHGLWGRDNQRKSSNYRELRNLVEAIEEGVSDGSLQGAELFLFTDNTVAEASFYKGNTSSSKVLFELIVRLRLIEMSGSVKLWVIHVAGLRMIQQGADGLSRGNLLEGVMTGVPMLNYVPLSISALTRSPAISDWFATWCPLVPQILTAEDWYFKGHSMTGGTFNDEHVWIPTSTSSGDPHKFWTWKGNCGKCGLSRTALNSLCCANFSSSRDGWAPCRSMWCGKCYVPHPLDRFHQHTPTDESGYVWTQPIAPDKFRVARAGDHFMTPFQCDMCIGRMLAGRTLMLDNRKDALLACCIRRANLDSLWGRETSTVLANLRHLKQLLDTWELVGIPPPMPDLGPFPTTDVHGVGVAISMLLRSLNPGKYGDYTQFATIRKERSCFSNYFHASAIGASAMTTLGRDTAKAFLTNCPTQFLWFERFSRGCLFRMGKVVKQDLALSIDVMLSLMQLFDDEWIRTTDPSLKSDIASVALYCVIAFCGSFRGHEVFLVDLFGLLKYEALLTADPKVNYCVIPLLGKYKGETGERYHLTPLAATTKSGLQLALWVSRVCDHRRSERRSHGPVFADRWGLPVNPRVYESVILAKLQVIKETRRDLIPETVNAYEDYGLSRSFRRGSNTHATNQGVSQSDRELMNRWRNVENARGRKACMDMADHYADIRQLIPSLLRYSSSL